MTTKYTTAIANIEITEKDKWSKCTDKCQTYATLVTRHGQCLKEGFVETENR